MIPNLKAILLLCSFLISTIVFAQTPITVNTAGMGGLKLGATKAQLQKLVGSSLRSKKETDLEWDMDTVQVVYQSNPYTVVLQRSQEDNKTIIAIYSITTTVAMAQTVSGIRIGDDKLRIIQTYEPYALHLLPVYDSGDFSHPSKTRSTIILFAAVDNRVLVFELTNGKVTSITARYYIGC